LKILASKSIWQGYAIASSAAEVVACGTIERFPKQIHLAYRYVYSDALNAIWISMTCICGLGLVGSLASRNECLDKGNKAAQTLEEQPVKDKGNSSIVAWLQKDTDSY
jgi:hypothetical protein